MRAQQLGLTRLLHCLRASMIQCMHRIYLRLQLVVRLRPPDIRKARAPYTGYCNTTLLPIGFVLCRAYAMERQDVMNAMRCGISCVLPSWPTREIYITC